MKQLLRAAIIIIFIFIVSFALFELMLRFFWQMSGLKGELYQKSANPVLRYELKPYARLNIPGHYEDVMINSGGFRDKEYPLQKAKNTYRIVVIGDSVTFSRLLKSEDTLVKRLEAMLNASCPEKKFEVLNLGVEGYNSIQELEMLKAKGLKYNPDLVIIYYCLNDPDYPEYYFKKNFINRHSLLVRYILYRTKKSWIKRDRARKGIKGDAHPYTYFYTTKCWQDAKEAVLEMGDLTQSRGIKMVLLIVPELSLSVKDFREGYPFWYIHDIVGGIRHGNIIIIDPVQELSRLNPKREELAIWTYPNLKANNIIAEYTLRILKEKGINLCN